MLCYITPFAWWLWVRGTPPRKAFREIARHSGEHCSIGFQPVSVLEAAIPPNYPPELPGPAGKGWKCPACVAQDKRDNAFG
jgi:hypothetical protein